MKAGDIVRLTSWFQHTVSVFPEPNPQTTIGDIEYPRGTIALILEVLDSHEDDGPSMNTYMRVLVGGKVGYVRAYSCEEIK